MNQKIDNNTLNNEDVNDITFFEFDDKVDGKKKNKVLSYIILSVCACLFILLSIYMLYNANKKEVTNAYEYKSLGKADYGTYYDEEKVNYNTLVRGYLTNVDINFNYNINFDTAVDGKVLYSVEVYWFAYNAGNRSEEIYKSDVEELVPLSEKTLSSDNNYQNNISVKLDYKKYLQSYLAYKSNSKISSQAVLVINYKVNSDINFKGVDELLNDDYITTEIPLSENTFRISTKTNTDNKTRFVTKISNNKNKKVMTYCSILFLIIGVLNIVGIVVFYVKHLLSISLYDKKINKIVKSYDNIIVDVDELPNISNKDVINVREFEELLDAQMQVRKPINFKKTNIKAVFMLVEDNIAWIYTIINE